MRCAIPLLLLSLLTPSVAEAQYAVTQGQTLSGLDNVLLAFAEPTGQIQATDLQSLYQSATLELRKVGIRIATDSTEVDMATDGVLNVTLWVTDAFSDEVSLRLDVEQLATLRRTGETLQMVTWFHESARSGPNWRDFTRSLLMDGVNGFLSDWLDANGR